MCFVKFQRSSLEMSSEDDIRRLTLVEHGIIRS